MISRAEALEVLELFSSLRRSRKWNDQRAFAPHDLGPGKALLLEHIGEHNGLQQVELAKATNTDASFTAKSVKLFIQRGWVRRVRSTEDGRAYVLTLTPTGRKLVKQFASIRDHIVGSLTKTLEGRDVQDFRRIVSKILDMKIDPSS
jgi:DNA-binding MarR family transcriptional regulator